MIQTNDLNVDIYSGPKDNGALNSLYFNYTRVADKEGNCYKKYTINESAVSN